MWEKYVKKCKLIPVMRGDWWTNEVVEVVGDGYFRLSFVENEPLEDVIVKMISDGHKFPKMPAAVMRLRREKKKRKQCYYPWCAAYGRHRHHVTYHPPFVRRLCADHHRDITVINTNAAERQRCKLSNVRRWSLWRDWLKGRVRPVWNENARRYMETFHD